jgi:hypothetical protein
MKMIKVIVKKIGKDPYIEEIKDDIEAMQGIVGGYIEAVPVGDGMYMVCNEDGIREGLKPNFRTDSGIIYGDVFFTRSDAGGDFKSVNQNDYDVLLNYLEYMAVMVYRYQEQKEYEW